MLILSFKFGYIIWRSHETRYKLCGKFFNHSDCQITMRRWLRSILGHKPMERKCLFSLLLAFSSSLSLYLHISPTRRQWIKCLGFYQRSWYKENSKMFCEEAKTYLQKVDFLPIWKSISCQLFFEGGHDNKTKKRRAIHLDTTSVEFVVNLPFRVSWGKVLTGR